MRPRRFKAASSGRAGLDPLPDDAGQRAQGTVYRFGIWEGLLDWRCCLFLQIDYAALAAETLKGGSDGELLAWAFARGRQPDGQEIEVWNAFLTKRGWRDVGTAFVTRRLAEIGLPPGTVETMFEFIDLAEGRLRVDGSR